MVNTMMALPQIQQKSIPFKETKKQQDPADVVLTQGLHLLLVLKDDKGVPQCVLDYKLNNKKETSESTLTSANKADSGVAHQALVDGDPTDNKPSGMASYSKKIGPLVVRNLGFDFAQDKTGTVISVCVDAQVSLGPIEFDLIGFSLNLNFKKPQQMKMVNGVSAEQPWTLHNLPTPTIGLSGLSIAYDKAPFNVAGMLALIKTSDIKMYEGAVAAKFDPWQFSAVGCYGTVDGSGQPSKPEAPVSPGTTFNTAFLFCALKGPLLTLAYAEISGVTGGFGYNSHLRLPNAAQVPDFPLVGGNISAKDAIDAQKSLCSGPAPWISPMDNSYWVAAGLEVKAFKMISVQALIVVE